MTAYIARAPQTPSILLEIGRLREIAFRAAGEGTGKPLDIDRFDSEYLHLFVWNHATNEIAGAYRLTPTDVAADPSALYTATLFRYNHSFLHRLGPALELGRSFVRVEYQRSFAPLLLLWKGICRFVHDNPRYKVLLGPVSISNTYSAFSRELMVGFLEHHTLFGDLARFVSARNPFRRRGMVTNAPIGSADELSDAVADIEAGGSPGIPVLLRQYLKLGGRLIGFNVDPNFSDALDGLIVVDLTQTDRKLLERYFGKAEAEHFLSFHRGEHGANSNHCDSELDATDSCRSHPLANSLL
jgi:putative hemolysin